MKSYLLLGLLGTIIGITNTLARICPNTWLPWAASPVTAIGCVGIYWLGLSDGAKTTLRAMGGDR